MSGERYLLVWTGDRFVSLESLEVVVSSDPNPDGHAPANEYTIDRMDLEDLIGESRLEAFKNRN